MRNQIDAADRAGIRAAHDQLGQRRRVGRDLRARSPRARSTCCWSARSGSTTRTSATRCCPSWPRRPGCWWSTRRTASATGATTSGPTTAGCGRCSAELPPACRCWPPRRPPTRGSPPTSPSSSAPAQQATTAGAARPAGPGVACTWPWSACPPRAQRLAWLAEHLDELPGSGIIYTLTVAAAARGRRVPARARVTTSPPTPARPSTTERLAAEDDLLANRVKALVATSALGMGFDKPDLGFVVHLGAPAVADRLLPADRPRRAAASTAPRWCCCPAARTGTSGPTSPRWRSRPSAWSGRRWPRWPTPAGRCPPRRWRPGSTCPRPGWR